MAPPHSASYEAPPASWGLRACTEVLVRCDMCTLPDTAPPRPLSFAFKDTILSKNPLLGHVPRRQTRRRTPIPHSTVHRRLCLALCGFQDPDRHAGARALPQHPSPAPPGQQHEGLRRKVAGETHASLTGTGLQRLTELTAGTGPAGQPPSTSSQLTLLLTPEGPHSELGRGRGKSHGPS